MNVKKILTTNVKNINPAYAGNVFFQRSEKNSKNGKTRYGKQVGSMARHQSYLLLGRDPVTGRFVSPKFENMTSAERAEYLNAQVS